MNRAPGRRRQRGGLSRLTKIVLVTAREFSAAAVAAYENVVAEIEAFDEGVDTSVRVDRGVVDDGGSGSGPYGRRGPRDDESPFIM